MKPTKLCYDPRLDDAADAVATDNRKLAKACMESDLIGMSHRAEAWLIKAWTCESLQETNIALQRALEIDPCNETARAGWNWVQGLKKLAETQRESKRGAERQAEEAHCTGAESAREDNTALSTHPLAFPNGP